MGKIRKLIMITLLKNAEDFSFCTDNSLCSRIGKPRSKNMKIMLDNENIVTNLPKISVEYSLAISKKIRKKNNLSIKL